MFTNTDLSLIFGIDICGVDFADDRDDCVALRLAETLDFLAILTSSGVFCAASDFNVLFGPSEG